MLIKNSDGTVDRIIATSSDNKNIMIDKKYKLVKFDNKKAFKDTFLGSDIGIHSHGFAGVAIISTLMAISTFALIYVSFRI